MNGSRIGVVVPAGFEPAAFRLGGGRSIQLSYGTGLEWLLFRSRVVVYQRLNVVAIELFPAF
jgi:hypothetical protein